MMNPSLRTLIYAPLLAALAACATTAPPKAATDASAEPGFLSDYSKLRPTKDQPIREVYVAPGNADRAARFTAVMVDQPELFFNPASKYKGIKPDEMKIIADSLRARVTDELRSGYSIVDAPSENVLYLRFAVTNLMLQKKPRPVMAYIPVGAVVYSVKNLGKSVTERLDLKEMRVEGEILDSMTMEVLAAGIATRDDLGEIEEGDKPSALSWDHLNALFTVVGKRVRCQLDNARIPEASRQRCESIGINGDVR